MKSHKLIVYWSDEDGMYIGQCPSLFGGGVHGPDRSKVFRELCQVVREVQAYAARHPELPPHQLPRKRRRARRQHATRPTRKTQRAAS